MRFPLARLVGRAVLAFSLALAANAAIGGKSNNTLNVAFPREVVTLDGLYSNLRENDILSLVVDDVLYTVNPQALTAQPLVALSHKMIGRHVASGARRGHHARARRDARHRRRVRLRQIADRARADGPAAGARAP